MKITFLEASVPLTKTFTLENGELKKNAHPRIIDVTSHEEQIETIEELHQQLVAHAALGHSFLKGNLARPLVKESRAGASNPNEPTGILMLDLDGLRDVSDSITFLRLLNLEKTDHIIQWSSSMGVVPERGMSAHIFVLLNRLWPPAMLKQWLINKNLSIPILRNNLALTRTNNALKWGLDVSTCQNDKLIYIAPPILGEGVIDHFKGERIQLVRGTKQTAEISDNVPSAEANRIEVEKAVNELRTKVGLPSRKKTVTKTHHTVEYQTNPDRASITDIKIERGFVYLNINGGDSWGYYHPENNPEFIYNFKGEPVYKTSELLPEYWSEVRDQQNIPVPDEKGTLYLALRDFNTSTYYNGTWNEKDRFLNIRVAKSKDQLHDFLKNNKQKLPDSIPDWEISFDPHEDKIVDIDRHKVNLFVPSSYMAMQHRKVLAVPPTIRKVIFNALGSDEPIFEHFMNTLACIFQYRKKAEAAWVFHGVQGTGKGMMINYILPPIFGDKYVRAIRMGQLDEKFNEFMEYNLILWIDEAKFAILDNQAMITGDLKNYITEPMINIRRMYTPNYYAKNYTTIFMVANEGSIIYIPRGDRRFNVAPYQHRPLAELGDTTEMVAAIKEELTDFAAYLATREADQEKARIPLNNSAKELLIAEGETTIEQAAQAVLTGNFQYFWDARPMVTAAISSVSSDQLRGSYMRLLKEIAQGKKEVLLREELQTLLEYTIGGMPTTPNKFTSLIKHHKLVLESVYRDKQSARGIKVKWKFDPIIQKEAAK